MTRDLLACSLDGWRAEWQSGRSELDALARRALSALDRNLALNAIVAERSGCLLEVAGSHGPLAGVPVLVKDCFVDDRRPPTCGSELRAEWMSGTAVVLQRLRAAGAAVVGYTNLHEWMIGTSSLVSAYGPVMNPRDQSRIAGGSSGGSAAAVAAGLVPLAVGTDAGGSIRIPAACCGVVGLKPTWNSVPTEGFVDHGSPIDHVGPLGRTVDEVQVLLEVLAARSFDLPDPGSLRVGIARRTFFEEADPEVARVVLNSVEQLRPHVASVQDVEVDGALGARTAIGAFILNDVARMLSNHTPDWLSQVQAASRPALEKGASITAHERRAADAVRERLRGGWARAFELVDVIVSPTLPGRVAHVGDPNVKLKNGAVPTERAYVAWNAPMNLGGVPCLSLPCGRLRDGEMVNLSVTARMHRDADALAGARLVESLSLQGASAISSAVNIDGDGD
jgi:Asp-tRNA(Asn)/Glu-tRNA(Gln) amidotransferase A subunit family amidase